MAEKEEAQSQISFLQSDFNTRLRDLEERNHIMKERILLLGKNLISSKENTENEIEALKKQIRQIQKDLDKLKKLSQSLLLETDKFVRRDEIRVIERMLKDFQPLEFIREKDLDELTKKRLKSKKT